MRSTIAALAIVLLAQSAAAHMAVDIKLSIDVPAFVAKGQPITYRIIADDLANNEAEEVVVTDTLPPSVTFIKASGAGWDCSESKLIVTCSAETIEPGENVIIIEVTAPSTTGPITNSASVESHESADPNTNNDHATATTTIYDAATCGSPALQIVGPSGIVVASPARLAWTAVPNAKSYAIYASVEGERSALVATTTQTSIAIPFEGGKVDWRVEAILGDCPTVSSNTAHFVSDGPPERLAASVLAAGFASPTGLALDSSGNLFVADSSNFTIHQIAHDGATALLAGSAHVAGASDGRPAAFNDPIGIAITPLDDFLYVADTGNDTIRLRYPGDLLLGYVITIGGLAGHAGMADGLYEVTRFSAPSAIAADPRGRLYVADTGNNAVRKMTSVPGYVGYYSTATFAGGLNAPRGVAVDGENIVYVADSGNHVVRKIAGGVTTTFDTLFNEPTALAVDEQGNVYVCDSGDGTVRKIAPSGRVTTVLSGLDRPMGIAIDANGAFYISDTGNHQIVVARVATSGNNRRRAVRP